MSPFLPSPTEPHSQPSPRLSPLVPISQGGIKQKDVSESAVQTLTHRMNIRGYYNSYYRLFLVRTFREEYWVGGVHVFNNSFRFCAN